MDLARACIDGGEGTRDRIAGIVVSMDADMAAGDAGFDDGGGDAVVLALALVLTEEIGELGEIPW